MRHTGIDQNIAKGLKVLRKRIEDSGVPSSLLDEQILIGSWNIRDFGKVKRSKKAIHYIAEILSYFDLVSLQELRANLSDLGRVMQILPPYWKVVFSDVTEGRRGNYERMAYLYDKRAVTFTGLAAEAVAPPLRQKVNGKTQVIPSEQFWRTPYIASFRAGTFDFILLSVHVQWGTLKNRETELERIADWVEKRRKSKYVADKDIILMGDFNIPKVSGRFYRAITKHGLQTPKAILGDPGSNLSRKTVYDQILFYAQQTGSVFTNKGGVADFYRGNHKALFPDLNKDKFTYQLSDHLPLWIVVNTDTAEEELDQILNPPRKRPKKKRRKPKTK
jgi:endonuclease/exonuclease/phosphatase family metal-dependent hydrolase